VLMHGTYDPVVPYGQSVGGYDAFRKAKYPTVKLRSLEAWNHWPPEMNSKVPHTSQQLAWCEGMTTKDPARLEAAFAVLEKPTSKERHDYAGLYTLAKHIVGLDWAPEPLKGRARKAQVAVESLAELHAKALAPALARKGKFERAAWVGHLPMFLRAYMGVPAREKLAEQCQPILDEQKSASDQHWRDYWAAARRKREAKMFVEGVAAIRAGFLTAACADLTFRKKLAALRKRAKELRLKKRTLKGYDAFLPDYEKALKDGARAFDAIQRKFR